ncbi:hypothetical protein [Streptomyces sp. NPDC056660]|uniref:hypothetical protein n=1 Tax=Streptomyces sp. NPDC056660 TaxID=3345897 RepID=UPI0036B0F4E1
MTTAHLAAALRIRVRPDQEQNVEPVAESLAGGVGPSAEAYVRPPGSPGRA